MDSSITPKQRAALAVEALKKEYPDAICSLVYTEPLQLLIATRLAAQCTDARVNMVTPELFKRYKTARDFAEAVRAAREKKLTGWSFGFLCIKDQWLKDEGGLELRELEDIRLVEVSINEQSRVDRERSIEKQKIELQESANARISKNTEMIEKLNATLEKAANYFAKLSGTQTAAQVVNNSSSSDNRSFIFNGLGMSYNTFLERLLKDIY